MLETHVSQTTYPTFPDTVNGQVRLNRRGEIVSPDWIMQLVLDGRCFMISNQAMETARDIGNASYTETEPAIAIDVPSGITMILLEVQLEQGGTAASDTVTALMTVDDKARITSGNAATARNMYINATEPNSSGVTAKFHDESGTALVVSAPAEDNTVWAQTLNHGLELGPDQNVVWSARERVPVILKGPASLCVYWYGTDNPEGFYHVMWAEIPTTQAA